MRAKWFLFIGGVLSLLGAFLVCVQERYLVGNASLVLSDGFLLLYVYHAVLEYYRFFTKPPDANFPD